MPRSLRQFAVHAHRRVAAASLSAFLLTGCQSFSNAGAYARVRVIDLSPDPQAIDVYHGNNAVAYNLSFGTVTSYVPILPGSSTLTVDSVGSKQILGLTKGVFNGGMQYTMLVNNPASNLQQVILTDHPSQISPSVGPSLRLIHQAAHQGPVDVYLVPLGERLSSLAPIATNLGVGVATSYINVPPGDAAIVMLPAGTAPSPADAVHSGRQTRYVNGVARTIIMVDAQPSSSSDFEVIMATDTEPEN